MFFMQTVHHRRFNAIKGFEYFDHSPFPNGVETPTAPPASTWLPCCAKKSLTTRPCSLHSDSKSTGNRSVLLPPLERYVQSPDAELKLGTTFARSALLSYSEGHMDHYEQAKGNCRQAIEAIQNFMLRVKDIRVREEMQDRLAELERLFSTPWHRLRK
jgi:hypothetical protein